jgi:hypothetical protein
MDNLSAWSLRAQNLSLKLPEHTHTTQKGHLVRVSAERWVEFVGDKNLERIHFSPSWSVASQLLLLALGEILRGKPLESAKNLSLRELEAFLRDRNSEPSIPSENYQDLEQEWPRIQSQISAVMSTEISSGPYEFAGGRVFAMLSLSEKIQELKAFFSSETLLGLTRSGGRIELLDVQGFDVFIALDSGSVPESALLDWLQLKLAEIFREPSLNLIPESFS